MSLKTTAARWLAARRARQIARWAAAPEAAQRATLRTLLAQGARTAFGRDHGFESITSPEAYAAAVPIRAYEALLPWVERAYAGEPDVLWPGRPLYFAETSGTTAGKKHIPLTRPSMRAQVQGAKDALLLYIRRTGRASFLDGRMIFLSGSPTLAKNAAGIATGRLSGIAQHFVPAYLQRNRLPTFATNSIDDWEAKVDAIVRETKDEDMRLVSGIPPWVAMYFERLRAATGRSPAEVWPNLRLYVEGGVDYAPYAPLIEAALGRVPDLVEVYPASEGFIAVQDGAPGEGLLLMLDYGIYYEFVPLEAYGKPDAPRLPLWKVEAGKPYAIVLSTNAGLWAYDIGDVVKFVSTAPYRLKVVGRVKHFISAFGEHVIEEEVNAALAAACTATGARVAECTVAPQVGGPEGSRHEWLVEFDGPAPDAHAFIEAADAELRRRNAYYDDLRAGGLLGLPGLTPLRPGAAHAHMAAIGKLGGQNKWPRLTNDRSLADALAPYAASE